MFLEMALGGALVYGLARRFPPQKLLKTLVPPEANSFTKLKSRSIKPSMARLKPPKSKPLPAVKEEKPSPNLLSKAVAWLKTGEITSSALVAKHKVQTQQFFLVSTASFALSTLGIITSYPLYLLSGLSLTFLSMPVCLRGLKNLLRGKINTDTLYLFVKGGLIATGNFWVGNFSLLIYALSEKATLLATDNTQKDLIDVFKVHPDFVWVVPEGEEIEVQRPFEALQVGDLVAVHAGEMIPADGTVVKGMATVDQHLLTGEAQPVEREEGQIVFASTVVLAGHLRLRVERAGKDTIVARIGQILNGTTDFKSTVQMRSQDLSDRTVLPTLILGALSLPIVGVDGSLAVISAHFKAKMNVIAPLSALNYFKAASKQGILFKDGRSLDLLHSVDTIVFDKTGTLTQDEPEVMHIHLFAPNSTPQTVLSYAASAEFKQTHPLARAIMKAALKQGLSLLELEHATYKVGYGLQVMIEQQIIRVGSFRFMESEGLPISAEVRQQVEQCSQQAHSLILVAVDQTLVGGT